MIDRQMIIKISAISIGLVIICAICIAISLVSWTLYSTTNWKPISSPLSSSTILVANHEFSPTPTIQPILQEGTDPTRVSDAHISSTATITTPTPNETIILNSTITLPVISPSPTIGPISFDSWCIPWHTEATRGRVKRIIDAITIEVEIDEEIFIVRYIGLALPIELAQPLEGSLPDYPKAAMDRNAELVSDTDVLLVKDQSEMDDQGRLLRYVIAEGVFVNQALVSEGFAQAMIIPPDVSCEYLLNEEANRATTNQRGMWAPIPTPTRPIVLHPTATVAISGEIIITFVQPDGTDWQDPDEFIEFRNISSYPIQMKGWRLGDQKMHTFIFPDFVINSGNYCRIYTNEYHPEHCGLSYSSLSPIWEEPQDCAYLYDSLGNKVDQYCYGY